MPMLPGPIEDDVTAPSIPSALAEAVRRAQVGSLLHWSGALELCTRQPRVAMIGTRTPCGPSEEAMESLAGNLAGRGAVVVSGAAIGTDMAAHRGALHAGGGTIACVPLGLGRIDPAQWRRELLSAEPGRVLLLSSFGVHQKPDRRTPAIRNRLIAALAEAVVVGEAHPGSGTLICLDHARQLGVPVFFLDAVAWSGGAGELPGFHRALEMEGARGFTPGEVRGEELALAIEGAAARFRAEVLAHRRAQMQLFDP